MSKFHSLEVVGRGGETQVQVGEISNSMTLRLKCVLWYNRMFVSSVRGLISNKCMLRR